VKQPGSRLKWWQLELIIPSMFALLVLEKKYLTLSPLGHQFMLVAIVLVVYGLIAYWLYVNQAAVQGESDQPGPWQRMAEQTPVGQPSSSPEAVAHSEVSHFDHPALPIQPAIITRIRSGASLRTWLN
jgi:hypothetical protein